MISRLIELRGVGGTVGQDDAEAGIPVENGQHVVEEGEGSDDVWPVRVTFCPIHERPEAVNFHKSKASKG